MKYNEIDIVNKYESGITAKAIADELGTYNTTIRRILLRNNIHLRGNSEIQASVKSEIFTNQTPERDYWLGFLAADGCVHSNGNRISLSCAIKDKSHLEKYADWLGIKGKEHIHKVFDTIEFRVIFRNKKIKKYLISLGITPRKSETIKLSMMNRDILRGILDGDGYVRRVRNSTYVELATASVKLADQIKMFVNSHDIKESSVRYTNDLYLITFYTQSEVSKLFDLLYKDATLFLDRKKNKFNATFLKKFRK